MIVALVGVALAGIPDGVRPAAAPFDAPERYAEAFPGEPGLACSVLLPGHAQLCFRVWEGKKRRWVTVDDIAGWKVSVPELVEHVTAQAGKHLELTERPIVDMKAKYRDIRDGDGWAVAPFLVGDAFQAVLGGPQHRVAIPRTGVLVTWPGGDPELDKVMAVGVREIYEAAEDSVSPMVHVYEEGRFVPFAVANPTGG